MGMTVDIKSSGDQHLYLNFSSSNYDGNGKWGSLHIRILDMQDESAPAHASFELDHADIDKLIQELQAAKGLLVSDESDKISVARPFQQTTTHTWHAEPDIIPEIARQKEIAEQKMSELIESKRRELFEEPKEPDMDAVCAQCGWKWGEHACNGACIERLPDNMMRFSKTERFTS